MQVPDSNLSSSQFSSIEISKEPNQVGAGVAEPLEDHFLYHDHLLKWIAETKNKLPAATPKIRREAFLSDPLLKGTIYPYLKNVLLQGFTIQTEDNKLYSDAITEIRDYLDQLDIMQVFREDFLNFMILDGHSYRRMDQDIKGIVNHLEKLEPSSITTYTDPWDSSIVAYHQNSIVTTGWTKNGTHECVDSWFIPFGDTNIYDTYIDKRGVGNSLNVFDLFETYKLKYNISDTNNLRIGSSERIIAMHNSERLFNRNYYDDDYRQLINPAPIDSVLLAIWLKRLLLVNAPNLIFVILSPFLHLKMGIIKESKDMSGNPVIISSLPSKPVAGSSNYAAELQKYTDYITATKEAMKNLMECLKNGGVFATGPDQEIKPVESSRSISFQMIQGLINLLDEEIGLNFGFPLALVKATGTELASSRNILQNFNTVHAGERTEYERVANKLIKQMFAGKTWKATTTKDGKDITVTYSFEQIRARFELDTPDTKDLLNEAQTFKTYAETLNLIKTTGASQEDLQALGEEYGFGLLGLDNYSAPMNPEEGGTSGGGAQQITAILKACLMSVMEEQGLISAVDPTEPSGFKEKKIVDKLQEAYKTAQETVDIIFEEH